MPSADCDVLIIGVGNTLRGDDGAGPYAVGLMEEMHLAGVETRAVHQLHLELLEEICRFRTVIVMDAAVDQKDVIFERVTAGSSGGLASSHHLAPQKLLTLARTVYGIEPVLMICSIPGKNFEMGEDLSPETRAFAGRALETVVHFLKEDHHA